ncbi:hypothetical protein QJQ45_018758 [Haematococcus lacustris]|nr:hypothetical protein QJQ45_018758 [Haematococcus lacustris]
MSLTLAPPKGTSNGHLQRAPPKERVPYRLPAVPEFRTRPGQSLLLVGSLPVLGQWNPAAGLPLSWRAGNAWQGSLLIDPGDELEAKMGTPAWAWMALWLQAVLTLRVVVVVTGHDGDMELAWMRK